MHMLGGAAGRADGGCVPFKGTHEVSTRFVFGLMQSN